MLSGAIGEVSYFLLFMCTVMLTIQDIKQQIFDQPDLYLDEIQDYIYEEYIVDVSIATIWLFLEKEGFTKKQGSISLIYKYAS